MRFHFMAGVSISLCAMSLALAGCGGGEAGAPTAIAAELVSEGRAQADNAPPVPASDAASAALEGAKILVFSKTAGYRHNSIGAGIAMLERLGEEHGFEIVATEDGAMFSDARIDAFDAVVFLNTTGDVLNARQQAAFERYIQSGGGYVGIHAASDTEHDGDWPWYIRLVGGTFSGHPSGATLNNVQGARITTAAAADDLGEDLPETFRFVDEWYDFDNLDPTTTPVLFIDRDSYTGAIAEGMERIAWYHDYDGGRVFYTNLGHRKGTFSDDLFLTHFVNGLVYAVGDKDRKPLLAGRPDADRFAQDALTGPLNEPVSLDVLDDGSVLIVERGGKIKRWKDGEVETVADYEDTYVSREEFGMIAVAGVMGDDEHLAGGYVMYDRLDGEAIMQRVAYVPFTDGAFDFDDQRLLLEWQMEDNCCHTGGALRFGPDGHLFIAVGDNSNPFMSDGLAPLSDETPAVDARRTAGNTNDLRGSIMRILPSADGTYEIPEDNLFADGGDGRPEIYVMGTRNPYTIGFDNDGTLYFGDIGPDARETTEEGPRGYDEINRVTEAGYFGWPLFIGDNEPYRQNAPGEPGQDRYYDPLNPVNDSPHNTGAETLPPAQPAFIYYPYAASERFPELGAGGRNALVAGVYHRPENAGEGAWPEFFEGKLIISDFMRRYVQAVAIGEGGSPERLTPVAQDAKLASPIDLEFGPDGALYVLEYGSQWFEGNDDARLSRIRYTGDGNRAPLLTVSVDKADGRVPLSIDAGTNGTFDPDGNEFTVEWSVVAVEDDADFGNLEAMFGEVVAEGMSADFTVEKPGRHLAIARATDAEGAATYAASVIEAGNERPEVAIRIDGNRTFFWPGREDVSYQVSVTDGEDGSIDDGAIDPGAVTVTAYVEQTKAPRPTALGHVDPTMTAGSSADVDVTTLLADNACLSCHQVAEASIGPSYEEVAARYASEASAEDTLMTSINNGGSGKWGDRAMPAYDFLDAEVKTSMIDYILGLHQSGGELPPSGTVTKSAFIEAENQSLRIVAQYTDEGTGDASALMGVDEVVLRPHRIALSDLFSDETTSDGVRVVDAGEGEDEGSFLLMPSDGAVIELGEFDLTDVGNISLVWAKRPDWPVAPVRLSLHRMDGDGAPVAAIDSRLGEGGKTTGTIRLALDEATDDMTPLALHVAPLEGAVEGAPMGLSEIAFERRATGTGGAGRP